MRAYYASKLSENISQSPEGYLICLNVPIARTGVQKYLASELKLEDTPGDELVDVFRSEEEVFSAAALASFEGKPLTNEHPNDFASPDNVCRLLKGICNNVRRGQGEDADKVIADVVAYDPMLINEIKSGKRGISCGYDCDWELDDEGRIHQRNIRGNHVAVVTAGRAGSDVAIHDKAPDIPEPAPPIVEPNIKRRKSLMSKHNKPKNTGGILGMLFPMFAKDADPEAVAEVLEALGEALEAPPADAEPAVTPAPAPAAEKPAEDECEEKPPKWAQDMMNRMADLEAHLKKPDDADPLAQLEKELAGGEESVTVEAEQLGDSVSEDESKESTDEAGVVAEGSGSDPKGVSDSRAAVLSALRAAKPVIAGIKDSKQRQAVTDSVSKVLRASLGIPTGSKGAAYSAIVDAKNHSAAGRKANDAAVNAKVQRASNLGDNLKKKFNPHYRETK